MLRQGPPEITIHTRNEYFHFTTPFWIWSFTSEYDYPKNAFPLKSEACMGPVRRNTHIRPNQSWAKAVNSIPASRTFVPRAGSVSSTSAGEV